MGNDFLIKMYVLHVMGQAPSSGTDDSGRRNTTRTTETTTTPSTSQNYSDPYKPLTSEDLKAAEQYNESGWTQDDENTKQAIQKAYDQKDYTALKYWLDASMGSMHQQNRNLIRKYYDDAVRSGFGGPVDPTKVAPSQPPQPQVTSKGEGYRVTKNRVDKAIAENDVAQLRAWYDDPNADFQPASEKTRIYQFLNPNETRTPGPGPRDKDYGTGEPAPPPPSNNYGDPFGPSLSQYDIDMADYQNYLAQNNLEGLKKMSSRTSPPLDPAIKALVDKAIFEIEDWPRKRQYEADYAEFQRLYKEKNLAGLYALYRRGTPPVDEGLRIEIDKAIKELEGSAPSWNTPRKDEETPDKPPPPQQPAPPPPPQTPAPPPPTAPTAPTAPALPTPTPSTFPTTVPGEPAGPPAITAPFSSLPASEMYKSGPIAFGVTGVTNNMRAVKTNAPSRFFPYMVQKDEVSKYADSMKSPSMLRPSKRRK
jgi:hypothetical protein